MKVLKERGLNETKYIIHFVKFQEWQKTFENLGDTGEEEKIVKHSKTFTKDL